MHKKHFQVLQTPWFSSEPLVWPAGSYWVCMFSWLIDFISKADFFSFKICSSLQLGSMRMLFLPNKETSIL